MAMITVLNTEGSTYSKAGSQMLVDAGGDFQGMLSGGCLEGDLAERSRKVIDKSEAELVSYDLRGDDDVFGLGVGCEGMLRILIQPLTGANEYQPLYSVIEKLETVGCCTVDLGDGRTRLATTEILAPLRLLILGAGKDAEPVVTFATELGWQVWVSDHRPAAVAAFDQGRAEAVDCIAVKEMGSNFNLARFDAVIVMSHNLSADRDYLIRLADTEVGFVGLLGPPHRRDRLLDEIGPAAQKLEGRLRGPVGKQIGGRGPAAIALEIIAELQSRFGGLTNR